MEVEAVPEHINFPAEEEKVLALWKELDAFRTSLKQSKNKQRCLYDVLCIAPTMITFFYPDNSDC